MKRRLVPVPKTLALIPLFLSMSLVFMIACGEAAPAPAEPQTGGMAAQATTPPQTAGEAAGSQSQPGGGAKPTPTLFIDVIRRQPTPTAMAGAAPTAVPTAMPVTADVKYGGHVPMQTYSAPVTSRPLPEGTYSHMIALAPLYNQIVEYNPETDDPTDIRCDLCTTWEISGDGLTYTYHLHEDGRWSDGEPITSEDMIFTIDSIVDPDDPQFGDLWKGHKTRSRSGLWKPYYESSRALDDYTVEVTLKYPSAAWHPALAMETVKMMPEHQVIQGKLQGFANTDDLVTSAAYRFVEFTKDVSWEYTKNPDYFKDGRPYLDGMTAYIIVDTGSVIAAFVAEQVLMTNGVNNNLSSIEAKQFLEDHGDTHNVYFAGPGGSYVFMMNTEKAPFNDPRVRRAMSLAMNRQELIETLSVGDFLIGHPFPPDTWFGPTTEEVEQTPGFRLLNGEKHPEDIAEAKRLLAEAGLAGGFDSEIMLRRSLLYVDAGTVLAQQYKRYLNVNLEIRVVESAAGQQEYKDSTYTSAVQGKSLPFMDPDAAFVEYRQGGLIGEAWARANNQINWDTLNDIFPRMSSETDQAKRKALLEEAADSLLNEDNAAPALFYTTNTFLVHKKIQNFHAAPGGYTSGQKWEHIWCDPGC
jgi:peptide/nickel transport system substrate-binding protein